MVEDLRKSSGNNYKSIIGQFKISNKKNSFDENLNPEIRIYNQPQTVTYEASINSGFFSDTYLTMSNISDSDIFNIKFQRKPFMNFIWISVLILSFGGVINFFNMKKRI